MKYHLNDDMEVKPCSAQKKTCKFVHNKHFSSYEEAEKYVKEQYPEKFKALKKSEQETSKDKKNIGPKKRKIRIIYFKIKTPRRPPKKD